MTVLDVEHLAGTNILAVKAAVSLPGSMGKLSKC